MTRIDLQEKIKRLSLVNPITGCWEWTAAIQSKEGYGSCAAYGRSRTAHRVSLHAFRAFDLDSDLLVCHHCDNRRCVNPDHLFTGTQADNVRDMVKKKRNFIPAGERGSRTILTTAQVNRVATSGESLSKLAKEFGVTYNCVWSIRKGINWSHTTGVAK